MMRAKVMPILAFDLTLVHAGQVVLDGVFGRDDLDVGPVELVERGVERGRLARAGRAGHEQDPVGTFDQLLEPGEVLVAEPEVLEPDLDVVAVEDPHDDRLTMAGWYDADPHVDVFAGDQDLDSSVLGPAFLGDVDEAHDLDTADDRAQQPAGALSRSIKTPSIR